MWQRRFGGDPQIVGRTLTLNARVYTVVGVMPPGFKGLTDSAELWLPFALYAPPQNARQRGNRGFAAARAAEARRRRGGGAARSRHDLAAARGGVPRHQREALGVEVSPLDVELFGELRPALLTLMAAVAFVLLIACANVANLLIARSEARQREIALRTALGAGWPRLLRQLMTEGCVLTSLGAIAGLLLAHFAVRVLLATSPVTFPSFVAPGINPQRGAVHRRRVARVRNPPRPRAGGAGADLAIVRGAQGVRARQRRQAIAADAQRARRRRAVAGGRAAGRRRPDDPLGAQSRGAGPRLRSGSAS